MKPSTLIQSIFVAFALVVFAPTAFAADETPAEAGHEQGREPSSKHKGKHKHRRHGRKHHRK